MQIDVMLEPDQTPKQLELMYIRDSFRRTSVPWPQVRKLTKRLMGDKER